MKQCIFRILFILPMLLQGCQLIPDKPSHANNIKTDGNSQHEQIIRLLRQGNRYDEMNSKQRKAVCKRLKLDYQQHNDWQTAWLLIYSLNENFNCVDLTQTLELLNTIQKQNKVIKPLKWLNTNQIEVLSKFNQLKSSATKHQRKSRHLQNQLNETETQLQQVISKIQALKTIESNINKKLDDE